MNEILKEKPLSKLTYKEAKTIAGIMFEGTDGEEFITEKQGRQIAKDIITDNHYAFENVEPMTIIKIGTFLIEKGFLIL